MPPSFILSGARYAPDPTQVWRACARALPSATHQVTSLGERLLVTPPPASLEVERSDLVPLRFSLELRVVGDEPLFWRLTEALKVGLLAENVLYVLSSWAEDEDGASDTEEIEHEHPDFSARFRALHER